MKKYLVMSYADAKYLIFRGFTAVGRDVQQVSAHNSQADEQTLRSL